MGKNLRHICVGDWNACQHQQKEKTIGGGKEFQLIEQNLEMLQV